MLLNAQFEKLDALLLKHRPWWQLRAFHCVHYPWQNAALIDALIALDDEQLQAFKGEPENLANFLRPFIEDVEELLEASSVASSTFGPMVLSENLTRFIPSNKLKQLSYFAQTVPENTPVLEWCAGKSHLGRALAASGHQVTAVEINPELVTVGQTLAEKAGLALKAHCNDVLHDDLQSVFAAKPYAVALHACGDLHQHLLKQQEKLSGLSVAPCCYHLTKDTIYQPLSAKAKQSALTLSKADLSLCLQETVTACAKMPALNNKEVTWRMAFDSLQRELRSVDEYLPLPALRKSQLQKPFAEFIDWALAKKGLGGLFAKTTIHDLEYYLTKGAERLSMVRRIELMQQLFKRPIELWLLLDKALYLQEQGMQVELFEFCDKSITPRNICLVAKR